jgi:hypothetical protein
VTPSASVAVSAAPSTTASIRPGMRLDCVGDIDERQDQKITQLPT